MNVISKYPRSCQCTHALSQGRWALLLPLFLLSVATRAQRYEAGKVQLTIERRGESRFASGFSAFTLPGHFIWGASVIRGHEDGRYYMFYAAMESGPTRPQFNDAWLMGAKIGVAVSDTPYGGFRHLGFVFNADGYTPDRSAWDAQTASNPHIRYYDGRYYLYYCASRDTLPGDVVKGKLNRRNLLQQNQKIGVISFASVPDLLAGRYTRCDKPLIDPRTRVKDNNILNPSPAGTTPKPDNIIAVNPAMVYNARRGEYMLYFKGNVYDPTWRGVHGVAFSSRPDGPFRVSDHYVFEIKVEDGRLLCAEDPYVWYHRKKKCYYAVFKDFTGDFTKGDPGLAIMYSKDGIEWKLPRHSLFMPLQLQLESGETVKVKRLERPQLVLDDNDEPIVLCAACSIDPIDGKKDGSCFNVQIPVTRR